MELKEIEQKVLNKQDLTESEIKFLVYEGDEIDTLTGEKHRWCTFDSTIIKIKEKLYCIDWECGLTEYQDNYFPNQPYEVEAFTRTITDYRAI